MARVAAATGRGAAARFNFLAGVAIDGTGNVSITDFRGSTRSEREESL